MKVNDILICHLEDSCGIYIQPAKKLRTTAQQPLLYQGSSTVHILGFRPGTPTQEERKSMLSVSERLIFWQFVFLIAFPCSHER